MRVVAAGNGLVLETADEWVPEGVSEPGVQELHGLYLRSVVHGVRINVRTQLSGARDVTQEGLLQMLHEQQWGSQPFDVKAGTEGRLTVVAGTFKMPGADQVVREFFVTDGRSLANAVMPGTHAQVAAAVASAARLVATIHFEASS